MFDSDNFSNTIYDVTNFSPETIARPQDNKLNMRVKATLEPGDFKRLRSSRARQETQEPTAGTSNDETMSNDDKTKMSENTHKSQNSSNDQETDEYSKSYEKEFTFSVNTTTRVDDARSCLELITYYGTSNQYRSWNLLQISPFKDLANKYWKLECIAYLLLAFHIIFMACFTNYNLPTKDSLIKQFNIDTTSYTSMPTTSTQSNPIVNYSGEGCWLIWPLGLVVIEMVTQVQNARYAYNEDTYKSNSIKHLLNKWNRIARPAKCVCGVTTAGSTAFFCLMTTWFCAYSTVLQISYQRYLEILAMTLLFGWMQTLKYFQYIRRWNVIINQMSSALLQGILVLFVVWSFLIILAFGFALHVLNLMELGNDRSPAHTIYLTFTTIQDWAATC